MVIYIIFSTVLRAQALNPSWSRSRCRKRALLAPLLPSANLRNHSHIPKPFLRMFAEMEDF